MICPKCGNEFEGTTCPKCNSPAIIVNASDYERRKREWEKRRQQEKDEEEKRNKNKEDVQRIASKIAGTDYKEVISSGTGTFAAFIARHKAGVSIFCILLLAVIIGAAAAIKHVSDEKNQLYISDGEYIYMGVTAENALCSEGDTVFSSDGRNGYLLAPPDEVDKSSIIASMCSSNGKYYASVIYKEDALAKPEVSSDEAGTVGESSAAAVNGNAISSGIYAVYVWERGKGAYCISEDGNEKAIKNISDNGYIVYTDTEYMNEGIVHSVALAMARIGNGALAAVLTKDVQAFTITDEAAVWLEDDGKLLMRAFDDNASASLIAGSVSGIYGQTSESCYLHAGSYVQGSKLARCIYATADGELMLIDTSDMKNKPSYMCTVSAVPEKIICESQYGCAYIVYPETIVRYTGLGGSDGKNGIKSEQTGRIKSPGAAAYSENTGELYYINASGELIKIKHKGKSDFTNIVIKEDVDGTAIDALDIYGRDLVFMSEGTFYCIDTDKDRIIAIVNNAEKNAQIQAVRYKRRIYYIFDKTLGFVTDDGKDSVSLGEARKILIGHIDTE